MQLQKKYDLIMVGTGFASSFFLKRALQSPDVRHVLVLERGEKHDYASQVERQEHNTRTDKRPHNEAGLEGKWWNYNIGYGGGSNCWWTNAMRFHPEDFELATRYGVGVDWPITYEDLEPYYCDAEEEMFVSGDNSSASLFPRSRPYPQLRHRYSDVGSALKAAYPEHTFAMPTTRSREPSAQRGVCCAVGTCGFCPNHAKFTVVEEMTDTYDDPRVTVVLGANVVGLETAAGLVSGVRFRHEGRERTGAADFVALGANGIYNPFILLKSGINDGPVGVGITEQIPINLKVSFSQLKTQNFSSLIGAVNFSFQSGPHRRTSAGGFMEINNRFLVRPDREKWNNQANFTLLLGDLRQDKNFVGIDPDTPDRPRVTFNGWSDYAHSGATHVQERIEAFLEPLGVDDLSAVYGEIGSHAHIEGSTVMGSDPDDSVIDSDLIHHRFRNLAVLGSGAYPTCSGSNPTLTIVALSLRSADRVILGQS